MPASSRDLQSLSLLPEALREVIERRVRELAGTGLIIVSALLALALATWSVHDPSLSHATNAPVRNVLGFGGAIVADLLTQLFGLAALALVAPIAIWGWRLASHRRLRRERTRIAFWLLGIPLWTACAAVLPRTANWPLPGGLGGIIGDWVLLVPAWIIGGSPSVALRGVAAIALALAALACLAVVAGFGFHPVDAVADHDEESEQRAISIGWITHGLLSFKARLRRLVRLVAPSRRGAGAERRSEPRFDAAPTTLAPNIEPDDDQETADELAPTEVRPKPRAAARTQRRSSGGYVLPPLDLLAAPKASGRAVQGADALAATATALDGVLGDFGVRGEIINTRPGPVVTLYELEPAPGIKSSRVIGLADDIARSMSALSARVAVVAGRNAIGIELPNPSREKVYLRELLASGDYADSMAKLPLCLGKTIGGEAVIADLARMPHLLIAGTTGSGKSVAINTMIMSLVYRLRPDQCRLIMVDPKMLELSVYDGIPHLL